MSGANLEILQLRELESSVRHRAQGVGVGGAGAVPGHADQPVRKEWWGRAEAGRGEEQEQGSSHPVPSTMEHLNNSVRVEELVNLVQLPGEARKEGRRKETNMLKRETSGG